MKKICLYSPPYPRVKSYYDMIDMASDYGFNALECLSILEFETPDIDEAKRLREYADSKNVIIPCFSAFAKLAYGAENIERLKKYADIAKIMGSPYLHHTIVGEFADKQKVLPLRDEHFKNGVLAVREIYDYAESIGIKTIYEEQGYIFNGIKGFGEFLTTVERNVGVVADFGNIYESGDDFLSFVKAFADKVVHAHIKDVCVTDDNTDARGLQTLNGKYMFEVPVGTGIVDMKEAVKLLKNAGYDGYYGLEFSAKQDDSPTMSEGIKFVESLL